MSSIDQQFIEFIVKSLVGKPDAVSIERTIDEKGVLLELTVDPEDLGRVIGKRGATAQSLRMLLRALGTKNDARYNLKIIDNGEAPQRRQESDHHDYQQSDSRDNDDSNNVTSVSATNDNDDNKDDAPADDLEDQQSDDDKQVKSNDD